MNKVKKIVRALVVCAGLVLILLVGGALVAPSLIDKTVLGSKIRTEVSALIGGDFDFSGTSLSFFPSPHVVLVNPQVSIEKQLSASAETIEVYPDILRLLSGHFTLKKAAVKQPKATFWVSESSDDPKKHPSQVDISQVLATLLKPLSKLSTLYLPVAAGTISQGSVTLNYDQTTTVTFNRLEAMIQNVSDRITFQVTAASNMFGNVSAAGSIRTGQQPDGKAHIKIGKVNLRTLSNGFLADAPLKVESGEAEINLDITFDHNEHVEVDFNGSAPNVRLLQAKQAIDIEVQSLSASVSVNPASATLALSELILGHPSMRVSGSLSVSEENPKFNLQLEGRNIDINAARSVSLALAGTNSVTQTIFDILKGGTIPLLTLSSQANKHGELADLDNLVLKARFASGEITIPGANMALTDVSGDVDISKGVLAGKQVLGRWQKSTLKDGILKIDLAQDPLPLHIKAVINVDAADIPPLLEHFMNDQTFNEELEQIENLQGGAVATLSLTGDTDQLNIAVSATDIKFSASHHKIPFPLKITDGSISYDGDKIQWQRLNGSLGTSLFTSVSGNIDLKETKKIAITSGASRIVIADMLPWLSANKATRAVAAYYGGGKGLLHLSEIRASGALQDLQQAHFSLAGELEDLTIQHVVDQPGPLRIVSLKFKADPEAVIFSDGRLSLLDASLTTSGKYLNYLKQTGDNKKELSLSFTGRVGPQLIDWISNKAQLPPWLQLLPLSIRESHLTYSNHGEHKIEATLALQDDLEVLTDVSFTDRLATVDTLMVKDSLSQVSLSGKKVDRFLNISFDGTLHGSTVSQIAHITPELRGSIGGKAELSLNSNHPFGISLVGELNAEKLSVPITANMPLMINNITVKGEPDSITITSANLSLSDTTLNLAGTVKPNDSGLPRISLVVEADRIDVGTIMKNIGSESKSQDAQTAPTPFAMPFEGEVRLKANRLDANGYTIKPLQVDIHLKNDSADITLREMALCGIPIRGTVNVSPPNVIFHLQPEAHKQQLNATLNCFADHPFKADGTFDLAGVLEGHGTVKDLLKSTTGHLEMGISDGHVYHDIILLNVLKFLNVTQVLTGHVSAEKMTEKGIAIHRFKSKVELQAGTLEVTSLSLDSDAIKLSGIGKIDILAKHIDFTLLVAPQAAANTILGDIPLVGGILQTMTTIPLKLTGMIDDVHVLPLDPSVIGFQLQNVMKQIYGLPLKIVHLDDYHAEASSGL